MACSRSLRSLLVGRWRRLVPAAENPLQSPEHSRERIEQCNSEESRFGEEPDAGKQSAQENDQTERMARAEINVLEAIETPGAHHQVAHGGHHRQPGDCRVPGFERNSGLKVHYGRNDSSPRRNWHADKVFLPRPYRI